MSFWNNEKIMKKKGIILSHDEKNCELNFTELPILNSWSNNFKDLYKELMIIEFDPYCLNPVSSILYDETYENEL